MNKLLLICMTLCLAVSPLFASENKEVFLRYSQKDNTMRIVLESDDNFIMNAKMIATPSSITIEFPDIIELKKQQGFLFETSSKERFLSIIPKNAVEVGVYKLSSPSRIVIDLKILQQITERVKALAEAITNQEAGRSAEKPVTSNIIFLDAGHGGYDYGIISGEKKEKDLDLLLTKDLNTILSKKGYKIFLTRNVDQSLSILDRITLANSKKPGLFISIHSSFSNAFVVYTAAIDESAYEAAARSYSLAGIQNRHLEKSRSLAKALERALKNEFKGDVFVRELPLPVLSSIDATAVMIEYPSIQLTYYDQKMRERLAKTIAESVQGND